MSGGFWSTCVECNKPYMEIALPGKLKHGGVCSHACAHKHAERMKSEDKAATSGRNVRKSRKQEVSVAERMGGTRVPGSGAVPGLDGDVKSKTWLIECKTTSHDSFKLTMKDWNKIAGEAGLSMRKPVMFIDINGEELAVVSMADFLAMKGVG